jgi:hypothetical protein
MSFVPGRRRKKSKARRDEGIAADNNVEELEWPGDTKINDVTINCSGRKRKCNETNDSRYLNTCLPEAAAADANKANKSIFNLLHLREIGVFGHRTQHKLTIEKYFIGKSGFISWASLVLCKPSPPPSNCSENDSTADDSDSHQWTDYSPPIYNIQYFRNSTDSSACIHKQIWRKKQIIPFSKLKTPIMDAILAIDRSGGYLIGLGGEILTRGGNDLRDKSRPKLLLKFFGEIYCSQDQDAMNNAYVCKA